MTFTGKIAVVTGGASGLGAAQATLYAREGAQVFLSGRAQANVDAVAQGIRASGYVRSRAGDVAVKLDESAGHPVERLPLPPSCELVVIHSGITHDHAQGDYRTRRAECEQAAAQLGVGQVTAARSPPSTRHRARRPSPSFQAAKKRQGSSR